jgi:biotin transporter BioY
VATSGTLTFADGEIQKTITIPTIDDHVFHPSTLGFRVDLPAPTGGYLLNFSSSAFVSLTDIDVRPTLSLEFPAYTVAETAGSLTVHVVRSGDLSAIVSVTYSAPGSFFDPSSQTGILTFFPGETVKTFTFPIQDDDVYNGSRQGLSI